MSAIYTHTGYRCAVGHVHVGRMFGHADYRGKRHALNGPERPYAGASYTSLCGETIRADDSWEPLNGDGLNIVPVSQSDAVTCKRCLAACIVAVKPKRKKCDHDWCPLITAKAPTEPGARLRFAFALGMARLERYDRCAKCGRISYLTKYAGRRSLVSVESSVEYITKRAAEFEEWAAKEENR